MHHRQVIPLEVVVDVHLPVARDVPAFGRDVVHLFAAERRDASRNVFQRVEQCRRLAIHIREKQRPPLRDLDGHQLHLVDREIGDTFHLRRLEQRTVETVRPAVIATLQRVALAASVSDRTRTMQTHVVKATQCVTVAQDHDRIVSHFGSDERAVLRDLIEPAHQLPRAGEDALAFQFQIHRIIVEPGRDGRGARDVGIEREDEGHGCGRENALRRVSRL